MKTDNSISMLRKSIASWHESLEDLLLMLQNDKPAHDNAALVGQLEDDVADVLGHLDHVREHVERAGRHSQAGQQPQALVQLERAQWLMAEIVAQMGGRAASPMRLQHIALIVQQRGSQWSGWSQVVLQSLSGWSAFAAESLKAHSRAWLEIAAVVDP